MKTFKFMSMLLASMALCCGLSSCDDDDDDDDVINVEQPTEEPVDYSKQLHGRWQIGTETGTEYRALGFDVDNGAGSVIHHWYLRSENRFQGTIAGGKYSLNSDQLTMDFDDIFVMETINDKMLDDPSPLGDFSYGGKATVTYTINSCDGTTLVLTDKSGKTFSYIKYKDN